MDDDARKRRLVATVIIGLPLLAAFGFAALVHFAGRESGRSAAAANPALPQAAAAAPAGSQAPRVRLREARSGRAFDGATLRGRPYAVLFISTRCGTAGGQLRQLLGEVSDRTAILVISSDPETDTVPRVRAWLKHHRDPPSLHYLIGSESQLRPYWRAWGAVPSEDGACRGPVAVHLVNAAGVNAGIVDLLPGASTSPLAADLRSLGS